VHVLCSWKTALSLRGWLSWLAETVLAPLVRSLGNTRPFFCFSAPDRASDFIATRAASPIVLAAVSLQNFRDQDHQSNWIDFAKDGEERERGEHRCVASSVTSDGREGDVAGGRRPPGGESEGRGLRADSQAGVRETTGR
jgi:hypothetical protein